MQNDNKNKDLTSAQSGGFAVQRLVREKREYDKDEVIKFDNNENAKCHCGGIPVREEDIDPYQQKYFYYTCLDCGSYSDCFFEDDFQNSGDDDYDDSESWLCQCGTFIEDGCHCLDCGCEPPWGCPCSSCQCPDEEDEFEYED